MSFRRSARKDLNQTDIVDDLRDREPKYDVDIVHQLKKLYDLVVSGPKLVGSEHVVCAVRVEVKRPGESLNENEEEYWAKQNYPENLIQAESADDVRRWFGEDV